METLQLQEYDEGKIAIIGGSEVDVYREIRQAGLEPRPLVFRVPREEDFQLGTERFTAKIGFSGRCSPASPGRRRATPRSTGGWAPCWRYVLSGAEGWALASQTDRASE